MQTKRGATLSPTTLRKLILIWPPLVALDQITKNLALAHLSSLQTRWLLGHFFGLELTNNHGAAFGSFASQSLAPLVLSLLAAAAIIWMWRFLAKYPQLPARWLVVAALALAGASGNLVDRVLRSPKGGVVDFIKLGSWPNFNLADSYLFLAAALAIAITLKTKDRDPGEK